MDSPCSKSLNSLFFFPSLFLARRCTTPSSSSIIRRIVVWKINEFEFIRMDGNQKLWFGISSPDRSGPLVPLICRAPLWIYRSCSDVHFQVENNSTWIAEILQADLEWSSSLRLRRNQLSQDSLTASNRIAKSNLRKFRSNRTTAKRKKNKFVEIVWSEFGN